MNADPPVLARSVPYADSMQDEAGGETKSDEFTKLMIFTRLRFHFQTGVQSYGGPDLMMRIPARRRAQVLCSGHTRSFCNLPVVRALRRASVSRGGPYHGKLHSPPQTVAFDSCGGAATCLHDARVMLSTGAEPILSSTWPAFRQYRSKAITCFNADCVMEKVSPELRFIRLQRHALGSRV